MINRENTVCDAIIEVELTDEGTQPWSCVQFAQRMQDPVQGPRIARCFDMLNSQQQMRIILSLVYCPPPYGEPVPEAYAALVRRLASSDDGHDDDVDEVVRVAAKTALAVLIEGRTLRDVGAELCREYQQYSMDPILRNDEEREDNSDGEQNHQLPFSCNTDVDLF
eukprot:PhM_4_TR9058/c0_g1_i1/m.59988